MANDITKLNTFCKRWCYQQTTYLKFVWKSFSAFLSHFPLGYVNLILQLLITIVSFPVFLGQALEFWIASMLIIKPTMEDVGSVTDDTSRKLIAKAQIRAIDDYKEITKTIITFVLGVVTTILTLYFTTSFFKTR